MDYREEWHGEKKYLTCTWCGAMFRTLLGIRLHLERGHRKDASQTNEPETDEDHSAPDADFQI